MKRTANQGRSLTMRMTGSGLRLACLTLAMLATPTVDAQVYRWVDPDTGMTVISNTPPPSTVRPQEIRKAPVVAPAATPEANAKIAAETGAAAKAPVGEMKPSNPCQTARQNLAALESRQPVSAPNAKGEPTLLNDSARAAELARVREFLRSNC